MEEQWINDLRKKMASHQTPVPPGLWEGIEAELGKTVAAGMPLRKKIVLWTTAVGSVAAAVVLAFLFLHDVPEEQTLPELATAAPVKTTFSTTITHAEGGRAVSVASKQQAAPSAFSRPLKSKALVAAVTPAPAAIPVDEQPVSPGDEGQSTVKVQPASAPGESQIPKRQVRPVATPAAKAAVFSRQSSPSRWSLQWFAGNLPSASKRSGGYGAWVVDHLLPQLDGDAPSSFPALTRDIIAYNAGKTVYTDKSHKIPIRLGLSARYQLNNRWSVESGLTYTFLSSELVSGTETHHFVTDQRLQYLGLPLQVNYDVWKNRTWNFYVSAGGLVEKCVYGRAETDYVAGGEEYAAPREHVMEKPLQWAVNGAVGAQVNLSSRVGLYAEPGVSYYFDNGSAVETIYKDKPFNFNFKLGFRLTLN